MLQFACIFCLRALLISDNVGQDTKISQCSSACTYLCSGCHEASSLTMHAIFLIFWDTQISRVNSVVVMFLPTKRLTGSTCKAAELQVGGLL